MNMNLWDAVGAIAAGVFIGEAGIGLALIAMKHIHTRMVLRQLERAGVKVARSPEEFRRLVACPACGQPRGPHCPDDCAWRSGGES